MKGDNVDDVGRVLVVVREIYLDVEAALVMGVIGMYAGDVVVFNNGRAVRLRCGL